MHPRASFIDRCSSSAHPHGQVDALDCRAPTSAMLYSTVQCTCPWVVCCWAPVSDTQDLLQGTQAAPEAIIGVDQAAPLLAVLARFGSVPDIVAHEVGHAEAG